MIEVIKHASNNFYEAKSISENEKIYPTLQTDEVITPFIQRQQSLTNLLSNTLDSKMRGIYCSDYLLSLKTLIGPLTKAKLLTRQPRSNHTIDCITD